MDWFSPLVVLAQVEQQAQQAAPGNERAWWFNLIPMVLIFIVAYFMLIAPEKKKQAQLQSLEKIKEKDHVITTSGIYGVVTNIQRDAGRVTLRVDESTGTKLKVSLAAIAQVVGDDDTDNAKDKS